MEYIQTSLNIRLIKANMMTGHECIQEHRLQKLDDVPETLAVIRHTLLGDEGKGNGMVDDMKALKSGQDLYGKAVAIALGIGMGIGWLSGNAVAIAKSIGAFLQHGG